MSFTCCVRDNITTSTSSLSSYCCVYQLAHCIQAFVGFSGPLQPSKPCMLALIGPCVFLPPKYDSDGKFNMGPSRFLSPYRGIPAALQGLTVYNLRCCVYSPHAVFSASVNSKNCIHRRVPQKWGSEAQVSGRSYFIMRSVTAGSAERSLETWYLVKDTLPAE